MNRMNTRVVAIFSAMIVVILSVQPLHAAWTPSAPAAVANAIGLVSASQATDSTAASDEQSRVNRSLKLSAEKADALFALLAPDHVKVMVRHEPDGIGIEGTAAEADALEAFVELVSRHESRGIQDGNTLIAELRPKWNSTKSYKLNDEQADALYAMLAFDDVPVLVSRDGSKVDVEARSADQRIVGRVVKIMRGQRLAGADTSSATAAKDAKPDKQRRATKEKKRNRTVAGDRPADAKPTAQPRKPDRPRRPARQRRAERPDRPDRPDATSAERQRPGNQQFRRLEQRIAQLEAELHELRGFVDHQIHRLEQRLDQPPTPMPPDFDQSMVVRQYELPPHHALNLYNLFAPDDIQDIFVSRSGNLVEIRARPQDQETIERLVEMVTRAHRHHAEADRSGAPRPF